jgi:transposase
MRVRQPQTGVRRTLYGQTTLTPEQIVRKLRQAEAKLAAGATVPEVARELGISEATFHRWKNRYGAMSTSEAKRLEGSWRRRMLASRSYLPRGSWT